MSLGNVKIQSNPDYVKTMATLAASVASLFTGGHCRAAGTRPKPLLMKTLNRKEACPESCCKSSLTNTLLPAVTLGGGLYQNLSNVFCSLRTGASYITEAALSQVDSQRVWIPLAHLATLTLDALQWNLSLCVHYFMLLAWISMHRKENCVWEGWLGSTFLSRFGLDTVHA